MSGSPRLGLARLAMGAAVIVLALQLAEASPALGTPGHGRPVPAHGAAHVASPVTTGARSVPAAGRFTGLGFDACSAPSAAALEAWLASPFRAVNIYIGGANRACHQPHLTAAWVRTVTRMGWRLVPTYVGLQAPVPGCPCAAMNARKAYAEGSAAAAAAVADATALGIGRYNPIYDDMENFVAGRANSSAVLAFLSGWTSGLHHRGYYAGVYGGATSGIADLVSARKASVHEPDDIWIAAWNNRRTTSDPNVPAGLWSHRQRIHQYRGPHNDTYGGVRINIDTDYCNGAVVTFSTLDRR